MRARRAYDAVVVGSGPNGLAAAITLAQAGHSVLVLEAADTSGGGLRSAELTLPGFQHDICAAVYPLAVASPFFCSLPLAEHGLTWVQPPVALAHPFDDGTAAILTRSVRQAAASLGPDARRYEQLVAPLVADWAKLARQVLGPLRPPRHPLVLTRFAFYGVRSACSLARGLFRGDRARGLFAGLAAHSLLPLEQPLTAAFGLFLGLAGHAVGWPVVRGGSQRLADALLSYLRSLGGEVATGVQVTALDDLPPACVVLFDVTPRQLLRIAGRRFPAGYRRVLARYRYGPGVFKVDWALAGPVPWRAAVCAKAATVHLGGTLAEIAAAERAVWQGKHPDRPFVLLVQPSLFDATRAPAGKHTLWAYCHVPNGSTVDMTAQIEAQIERFAPGFRDRILARSVMPPARLEAHNANCIGGDITGGVQDFRQLFTRPTARAVPYSTPARGIYICSASTPPGGGVHGMCGYYAARAASQEL